MPAASVPTSGQQSWTAKPIGQCARGLERPLLCAIGSIHRPLQRRQHPATTRRRARGYRDRPPGSTQPRPFSPRSRLPLLSSSLPVAACYLRRCCRCRAVWAAPPRGGPPLLASSGNQPARRPLAAHTRLGTRGCGLPDRRLEQESACPKAASSLPLGSTSSTPRGQGCVTRCSSLTSVAGLKAGV